MPESYVPLPTESDYFAAAELCEEDFQEYGGPWVRLMRDELYITQPRSESEQARRVLTAKVAINVEDGRYENFQATHTFARGMRAGYRIISLIHPQGVSMAALTNLFQTGVGLSHDAEGELKEGSLNLEKVGETGLDIAGEKTTKMIEMWAQDMTREKGLQRLFTNGAGAAILGAYALHVNENYGFINAYLKQTDFTSEIEDILASDTGE